MLFTLNVMERVKTGISLYKFPKDNTEKRRWINMISMYQRKGAGDNFSPYDESKKYFVCEHHFKADEIRVSLGIGRKTLKPGAIPSIFNFKNPSKIKPRKSPKKRCLPAPNESTSNDSYLEEELETNNSNDLLPVMHSETNPDRTKLLEKEVDSLKEKINFLEAENSALKAENDKQMKNERLYNYENISRNKEHFKKATGLDHESFLSLFEFVDPGEDCKNIKFYDSSKRLSEAQFPLSSSSVDLLKSGRKPKVTAINQLFLYLVWLRNGFTLQHLSWLFDISIPTASRYIITWTNFLYLKLGNVLIWPTREQVDEYMSESFRQAYPSTRRIIDCTELYCQRPSSLSTQSALYSHYKSNVTYKGLIVISPSGSVTFISQLFDGSISDREIVSRSGFL